jgi:acetyltransferase-like isoleucine patch superfamily enzyme
MNEPVFTHPAALNESETVGAGTRIWAFAHVMKGATIGSGCNIGDHSFIESGVRIGHDVTVKNGVSIWEGVTIGDKVFVGPNAVFTNDLRPRSKVYHSKVVATTVLEGATIGANATVVAGVTIGKYSMVGAGAVVTRDVKDFELVTGNPARHHSWVDRSGKAMTFKEGVTVLREGLSYTLTQDGVQESNQ